MSTTMKKQSTREKTDFHFSKASEKEKPYKISDQGGLYLLVTPAGGKLWRWKYRFNGKQNQLALGKYPEVGLADARARHAEARRQLAHGIDPMAARKDEKIKQHELTTAQCQPKNKEVLTLEQLTKDWHKMWKIDKDPYNAKQIEDMLSAHVLKHIGSRPAAEVTRGEIVTVIKNIITANGKRRETARRTLMYVDMVYREAMHSETLKDNPAATIEADRILPGKPKIRKKYVHIKVNELPVLLAKMSTHQGNQLAGIAMELVALTFLRSGNILKATWNEIDWTNKIWRIPGERMKSGLTHLVPLTKQTLAVLGRLKKISGKTEKLFPAQNGEKGTICNKTILNALERIGYKGRMTAHGFRHIASTFLRARNYGRRFDKWLVEAQLAHIEPGTAGIYNEADYLEERAEMMQFWADALDRLRCQGVGGREQERAEAA